MNHISNEIKKMDSFIPYINNDVNGTGLTNNWEKTRILIEISINDAILMSNIYVNSFQHSSDLIETNVDVQSS
ncbi:unnamed protein product [Adineta ricciae]|uniref:Uncharacterized protein n=1 Tax=Adineta ricciae TaxID=249248 RepID=A0A813VVZ0_ADIRI|nr:unnamed protein product [Adineta ricciae]